MKVTAIRWCWRPGGELEFLVLSLKYHFPSAMAKLQPDTFSPDQKFERRLGPDNDRISIWLSSVAGSKVARMAAI